MKRIHVVGRKNHGKTTLIVDLIGELARIGYRVGVVKHSSHKHELDTPGKDSHRHRLAGASPVSVVTDDLIGVYLPRVPQTPFYDCLEPLYRQCDLVVVEGHIDGDGPKVEVWRSAASGGHPLAEERGDILAVVTDDNRTLPVPVWRRSHVAEVAQGICRLLNLKTPGDET